MQDENVTVFGHFLHMHATGRHMITHQYRDDVLIHTARVVLLFRPGRRLQPQRQRNRDNQGMRETSHRCFETKEDRTLARAVITRTGALMTRRERQLQESRM